ncbi:MAG TPA: TRAP transporter small permease subunit [Woeseiaceae bacterium]|nr:TRAP transporter small permease subunit [Woeseiaceae bacterium]
MDDSQARAVAVLDAISRITGNAVAWMTLAMVLVTSVIVCMRYLFEFGVIWLQESVTWMHAMVFMLGAAYTLQRDEHVRVDILYRRMSARGRALVDAVGVLLFVLPLCGFIAYQSWGYVVSSWSMGEVSVNAGGLPYPFVPLMKSALLVMPAAVALQGASMLLRSLLTLRSA